MITCSFRGRLGNQLFIAATTIAHAIDQKTGFNLPLKSGKRNQYNSFLTHLHDSKQPLTELIPVYKEHQFGIYNKLPNISNLHLQGYFQSEKYFKHHRDIILGLFNFPHYPKQINKVSVHIRRGDYLQKQDKYPFNIGYVLAAMDLFEGYDFLFFSDDIEWCKENFKGDRYFFSENRDAIHDITLMSSCTHNIITNSTFSWWGAWMNDNPDKIVITPSAINWFGEEYKDRLSTQDIIPETWTQLCL